MNRAKSNWDLEYLPTLSEEEKRPARLLEKIIFASEKECLELVHSFTRRDWIELKAASERFSEYYGRMARGVGVN